MNNDQFRRLVAANAPKSSADQNGTSPGPPRPLTLGSRTKSSIPMTPRSVAGLHLSDFARQVAERNPGANPDKKFRSYDPKGSKLAQGYTDRAKSRTEQDADDRAERLKALEESLKKEEIDQATFDQLRFQIAGGDLSSTHLVKGLDFKLLERIRKGEDVYDDAKPPREEGPEICEDDVDEALDRLEGADVDAIAREKTAKKGELSTTALNASKKRTRDQILAEMKAARGAAKSNDRSTLGTRFKKIGAKAPGTRVERDSKGREVLIVVDEDGHEKRKVRKVAREAEEQTSRSKDLMMPDKTAKPLGMEVPDFYRRQAVEPDDEDVNIFDEAGDDYNPLADLNEDSGDDESEAAEAKSPGSEEEIDEADAGPPPPSESAKPSGPRNYFKDSKTTLASEETLKAPSMSDPAVFAALKKAAALQARSQLADEEDEEQSEETRARVERRRKMLQTGDRDAQDMDLGFGTSRFEDEEDLEDKKVKLSQWNKDGAGEGHDGAGGGSKPKRKRGGKKRKGDGNNAADVMRIVEQRRAAE